MENQNESIIIIKRPNNEEPAAKGGAWKIAYADFVTAMMAFFLVMWLVNAANDKTKSQVASYFNPIMLTDTVTSSKGINDPKTQEHNENKQQETTTEDVNSNKSDEEVKEIPDKILPVIGNNGVEEQIFHDPYSMLAKIAGQPPVDSKGGDEEKLRVLNGIHNSMASVGNGYSDPFDPLSWADKQKNKNDKLSDGSNKPETKQEDQNKSKNSKNQTVDDDNLNISSGSTGGEIKGQTSDLGTDALKIKAEIQRDLKQEKAEPAPELDVKKTNEGIIISLTDNLSFNMFELGSATPNPEAIKMMERVASSVKNYNGKIIIRGHTDARKYRSKDYDNWRLSTARAQMAYYLLVRAGVDDGSVERIEGYADRDLKNKSDPESAENRRIEILLKTTTP